MSHIQVEDGQRRRERGGGEGRKGGAGEGMRGRQRDEEAEKEEKQKRVLTRGGRTPYTSKEHPSRTNTRTQERGETDYEIIKIKRGQKS